jgi:hypothetical protein
VTKQNNAGRIRVLTKRLGNAKSKRLHWAEVLLRKPDDPDAKAQLAKYDSMVEELRAERLDLHRKEGTLNEILTATSKPSPEDKA